MTQQLFDVVFQSTSSTKPIFIMRAPMTTIKHFLDLHNSTVQRIEDETKTNDGSGICDLFDRRKWGVGIYRIMRARGDLGETRLNLDVTELLDSRP